VSAFGCLQPSRYRGVLKAIDDADFFVALATVFGTVELYRTLSRLHDNHLNHHHDVVFFPTLEVVCSPRSQMAFPPPGCNLGTNEIFPRCSEMFAGRYAVIAH